MSRGDSRYMLKGKTANMQNRKIRLYRITADYRKNNPNKPHYYVWGRNIKEAKDRFKDRINWLNIYAVEICEDSVTEEIIKEPMKHIII